MKMSKIEKVLEHLKEHGSITSWEAILKYGATRLSGIIYVLRHRNYEIDSIDEHGTDPDGNKTTYTRYELRGEKDENVSA